MANNELTEQLMEELEDAGLKRHEAEQVAIWANGIPNRETVGAERVNRINAAYFHTTNPETGDPVVFMPGERLPDWAWELQNPTPETEPDAEPVKSKSLRALRKQAAEVEPAR